MSERMVILEPAAFRARYGAVLEPLARDTARTGASLARRVRARRALVVSAYAPNPDQSTLWWYDQGLLSLLAAAGLELVYATDASYELDERRLRELDARVSRIRLTEVPSLAGSFDFVVALTPSDVALEAAERFGAPLVAFGVKSVGAESGQLSKRPAPGTKLWHAFSGDIDFVHACENHLGPGFEDWVLRGAPFPANRYYFPPAGLAPTLDALLFGTKDRDIELACAALARAGVRRFAALGEPTDHPRIERAAAQHGLAVRTLPPQRHLDLLALVENARMVVNPVTSKSHYAFMAPLALGVPVVATDSPSARVFVHGERPAVELAPAGDVAAWAEGIRVLLDDGERRERSRAALEQTRTRHDLDRFFASAIVESLS